MINDEFERMERIIGSSSLETLKNKRVAVFGVGGVGSFACEALVRASIGFITLIDNDDVAFSNINRQLIALPSTTGKSKVDVMKERILDINPECCVVTHKVFYSKETENYFDLVMEYANCGNLFYYIRKLKVVIDNMTNSNYTQNIAKAWKDRLADAERIKDEYSPN